MALAVVRRDVQFAEEQRERIAQEQRRTLEGAREAAKDRFDASEVRQYYQYERHLARMGVESDARIRELNQQIEVKRGELLEAAKRKKIVELLKEHEEEAFLKAVLKQEQKDSDEVAVNYAALSRSTAAQQEHL